MTANGFTLEICANSYQSAEAAVLGGAHRIELCDNMHVGGTTPSYGLVKKCLEDFNIPIHPIIRPRGGNFIFSEQELEIMCIDIEAFQKLGCKGVVIGCLNKDARIHKIYSKTMIAAANGMEISFHRAFDRTANLVEALYDLQEIGIRRVLTSGGQRDAEMGIDTISKLVALAGSSIEIMPGSGITKDNIAKIHAMTGAKIYHTTAKTTMISTNTNPTNLSENVDFTSTHKVKELIQILSKIQ